jgi:hypothetical protein
LTPAGSIPPTWRWVPPIVIAGAGFNYTNAHGNAWNYQSSGFVKLSLTADGGLGRFLFRGSMSLPLETGDVLTRVDPSGIETLGTMTLRSCADVIMD